MSENSTAINQISDVLIRLKQSDEHALEEIFTLYKDKLYAFCYKTLKSKDLSDDIVIEVFTKVWEKRETIHLNTSFESFLLTITKNHLLNYLKKVASEAKLKEQIMLSSEYYYNLENKDLYQEYLTIAEQTIKKMPPQRQKVFRLRLDEGLTYEEIASELGLSRNTVKSHLSEGARQLKHEFKLQGSRALIVLASASIDIMITLN